MMLYKYFISTFILLFIAVMHVQAEVTASMKLQNNVVRLGESTKLTVTMKADDGESLRAPEFPEYDWALVQNPNVLQSNNSIHIVNGQMTSSKTLVMEYTLTPLKTGTFELSNVNIPLNEKVEISPIAMTVLEGNAPTPTPRNSSQLRTIQISNEYGLALLGEPNKEKAYVGEEIHLTYSLLYPRALGARLQVQKILDSQNQFKNFWTERIQLNNRNTEQISINGKLYSKTPILRYIIYPLTPGNHTIEPIEIRCNVPVQRNAYFGFPLTRKETVVSSESLTLDVDALPETNQPDIFEGAVGQYNLETSVDNTEIQVGDHITLAVTLTGHGNLKQAPKPTLPELNKFDIYDPEHDEDIRVAENGTSGSITYKYVLLPHDITATKIDPVRFAYFNPDNESYKILETRPIVLSVEAGNTVGNGGLAYGGNRRIITRIGDDFRFINTSTLVLSSVHLPVYTTFWYWFLFIVAAIILIAAYTWRVWKDYLNNNPNVAKSLNAPKQAKKLLSEAKNSLDSGKTDYVYPQLEKAILKYISNRWNISAAGLTQDELNKALQEKNISDDCIEEVLTLLDDLHAVRFSGVPQDMNQVKDDYSRSEKILGTLMNQKAHA